MRTVLKMILFAVVLFPVTVSTLSARPVKVMTKNMDAGTDLGFVIQYLQTNPLLGVQLTYQEVLKNNYAVRAGALAKEIVEADPDIVGLQEVTLWRTGPNPANANTIVADQISLLLGALAALGQPYSVVATNTLTDVALPLTAAGTPAFRWTDSDVVIVRSNLLPGSVANVQTGLYNTLLHLPSPFGTLTVLRGWISADVTVDSKTFRFVTTHLESSGGLYGNPDVDLIQAAQAQELVQILNSTPMPVVLGGDLNSNATHTPPEQTLSVKILLNSGYADTWSELHHGNPGFTWPIFLEDPLRDHQQGPKERIDFIFERGFDPVSVDRTGLKGLASSDHAGVVAVLKN